MTDQWWQDDDRLLAELDEAMTAARRVPERFVEAGKAAFAWRSVDLELAVLSYDSTSAQAAGRLASTRGEHAALRALTFSGSRLSIDVEVSDDAVRGQIRPPEAGEIQVRDDQDTIRTVQVDDDGWFVIAPPPVGPFTLAIHTASGVATRTDRMTL
jgi:hypothetical protein